MSPWINIPKQRKMMIKEKCKKNFDIMRKKYNNFYLNI